MSSLSLIPDEVEIKVIQGTDNPIRFQITKANSLTGLVEPVDLSNDTVKFTARESHGGVVKISTKVNGPGQHFDAPDGYTDFVITRGDTLVAGQEAYDIRWVYEVRRVDGSTGLEFVHFQGELVLNPTVRPTD